MHSSKRRRTGSIASHSAPEKGGHTRGTSDVLAALLPPLETLQPNNLDDFSKEEIEHYLSTQGIQTRSGESRHELQHRLKGLIFQLQGRKESSLSPPPSPPSSPPFQPPAAMQHFNAYQQFQIPSLSLLNNTNPFFPYGGDEGHHDGHDNSNAMNNTRDRDQGKELKCVECRKKANSHCKFQRCRGCCQAGGFDCQLHIKDANRAHERKKNKLAAEGVAHPEKEPEKEIFKSPQIPSIFPSSSSRSSSSALDSSIVTPVQVQMPFKTNRILTHLPGADDERRLAIRRVAPAPPTPAVPTSPFIYFQHKRRNFAEHDVAMARLRGIDPRGHCISCGAVVSSLGANFWTHLSSCNYPLFLSLFVTQQESHEPIGNNFLFLKKNEATSETLVNSARINAKERFDGNLHYLSKIFSPTPSVDSLQDSIALDEMSFNRRETLERIGTRLKEVAEKCEVANQNSTNSDAANQFTERSTLFWQLFNEMNSASSLKELQHIKQELLRNKFIPETNPAEKKQTNPEIGDFQKRKPSDGSGNQRNVTQEERKDAVITKL